jgi:hypothetical protein
MNSRSFYRGVLYTVSQRTQYNFEKGTETVITEYVCNDKDLLHDYDVKQFVTYNEQDMLDLIDYYFDEYEDYIMRKKAETKYTEEFLKQVGWQLD